MHVFAINTWGGEIAKTQFRMQFLASREEEKGPEPGVQPVPEVGRYVKIASPVSPVSVTFE